MNITITRELEQLVRAKVASGLYKSPNDVVREGLRLLEERDRERPSRLEEIRGRIAIGLEQANRGDFQDGEKFFEEIEKKHPA